MAVAFHAYGAGLHLSSLIRAAELMLLWNESKAVLDILDKIHLGSPEELIVICENMARTPACSVSSRPSFSCPTHCSRTRTAESLGSRAATVNVHDAGVYPRHGFAQS